MSQHQEEAMVIKVSKLLRDGDAKETILTSELVASIEEVIQELVGEGSLVEIIIN